MYVCIQALFLPNLPDTSSPLRNATKPSIQQKCLSVLQRYHKQGFEKGKYVCMYMYVYVCIQFQRLRVKSFFTFQVHEGLRAGVRSDQQGYDLLT